MVGNRQLLAGIGPPYQRSEVGAHENSASPYGTFDQGGNVREWNEQIVGSLALRRGLRGGSTSSSSEALLAADRGYAYPDGAGANSGFRVVSSVIPEPSTVVIWSVLGLVGIGAGIWRKRKVSPRYR